MTRPNVDMMEALRLTREGRLQEAMAVLQGAPSGGAASGDRKEAAESGTVLDMVAPSAANGQAWSVPPAGPSPSLRGGFLDRLRKLTGEGGVASGDRMGSGVPAGARFEGHVFANEAGTRSYKLYVPSRCQGEPLPLLVMLHGCTQSPDDFAAGTRMNESAEEHKFLVAYPAQPTSANPSKCWNWFNGREQRRDQGEPSLVAGITRQVMHDFPVARGRVYVAGLSAGGAAAATLGTVYPDLYAAVGVHSGLACGAAHDMPSAFAAMGQGGGVAARTTLVPTIAFHGDADRTVNPVNGDQVVAQARPAAGLETRVSSGTAAGGVSYTRTIQVDGAGRSMVEKWILHGVGHAWSGGSPAGSYTDQRGPDASREMVRFFLQHSTTA